ncbi:transporter substrate-binding domain-containing protein [Temperatibacter marinus]|uniref:Transporter substrate-binding domain-containing protein n=1 Tax=Temperatibacter marinus TaxID=1456591 RepID=A0AA52H8S4_9PROT|nr:transporter substrate-binding domain-containing protein [Temperatibacter marinus]WND01762.1 transporter substrate-binding domain-containing protein [Temperatibacter marinus]
MKSIQIKLFTCLSMCTFFAHIVHTQDVAIEVKDIHDISFVTHSVDQRSASYIDGILRGQEKSGRRAIDVEIIQELKKRLGHKKPLTNIAFTRAIRTLEKQPGYALFNVLRTPARESKYKWVGPLQHYKTYFHDSAQKPSLIETMDDAKKVKGVCVVRGNAQHDLLKKLNFNNLIMVSKYTQCISLVMQNKGVIMPSSASAAYFEKMKVKDLVNNTEVVVTEFDGYLAFSKSTPDYLIKQAQETLDEIKADGTFEAIVKKYGVN